MQLTPVQCKEPLFALCRSILGLSGEWHWQLNPLTQQEISQRTGKQPGWRRTDIANKEAKKGILLWPRHETGETNNIRQAW